VKEYKDGVTIQRIACLLALGGLTGYVQSFGVSPTLLHTPPLAGLVIFETEINWGTIASTQPATRTVTIKNESTKTISIDSVRVSCMCLTVELEKRSIAPGESTHLKARLDPTGYIGNVHRTAELSFSNESGEESVVTLSGRAFVQEPIQLSVPLIAYKDIDLSENNERGYYISDPVLLTPTSTISGSWSPVASIPENFSQAFVATIDKRNDSYILETYFFPKQLLAASHDRSGEFNIKIHTDATKSQFVNLPVHWHIKSNFRITPERPLFIDSVPQDDEYLSITSSNGSAFEINNVIYFGKTIGRAKISKNEESNAYQIKLIELARLIDKSSGIAQAELTITTNRKDEPVFKISITTLFTEGNENGK